MKTDIEISNETQLKNIEDIAKKAGINPDTIEPYGHHIAKIPLSYIDEEKIKKSNLILVTSISPTKAGIGKTTVSVGLNMGLNFIGEKSIVVLREPSLGPCFGMKGGACGGGYAQVLPMDKINLHFTGDFHAVTAAHNMITAMMDNYFYQNSKDVAPLKQILWKRVLDVNDRNLRHIVTGIGPYSNGITAESGFDITPASEIMAILCISKDLEDLRNRIDNILLGYTIDGEEFTVSELGITGSIVALLKDAFMPNLVQDTEGNPAIIHGGPFANIAQGTNTIVATKLGMSIADYVVTEAGFGADLGAEKFLDIKCRAMGIYPKLTVVVATCQGLKMHGGVNEKEIKKPNLEGLKKGFANLDKHVKNMQFMGQTVIVAFNKFIGDTDEEITVLRDHCWNDLHVKCIINDAYSEGSVGAAVLARKVVEEIKNNPSKPKPDAVYSTDAIKEHFITVTYNNGQPDEYKQKVKVPAKHPDATEVSIPIHTIKKRIENVAYRIYGASTITFSPKALKMLEVLDNIENVFYKEFPVCIAKTQYSFTDNPKRYGCPKDFNFTINDIVINRGAGFIVAIAGDMMRMPGLPKFPAALNIDVNENGQIIGLN